MRSTCRKNCSSTIWRIRAHGGGSKSPTRVNAVAHALHPGNGHAQHLVQRLPVVVDDPPVVAHVVLPPLQQRLEDVACASLSAPWRTPPAMSTTSATPHLSVRRPPRTFVQLGVADEGDHPARPRLALGVQRLELGTAAAQVVLDVRLEGSERGTEAHRARGKVLRRSGTTTRSDRRQLGAGTSGAWSAPLRALPHRRNPWSGTGTTARRPGSGSAPADPWFGCQTCTAVHGRAGPRAAVDDRGAPRCSAQPR